PGGPYAPVPGNPYGSPPPGGPYAPVPGNPYGSPPPGGPYAPVPGNPYGSPPQGEGPRPPAPRGFLTGCAVFAGLCCTCRMCCAKEYEGPWSRRKKEGFCRDCDCDCGDCGCCNCCEGCDGCGCCDCGCDC
ncbi:hypothetical protein ABZ404_31750, partial [Streptomyces sp. NPDC005878]